MRGYAKGHGSPHQGAQPDRFPPTCMGFVILDWFYSQPVLRLTVIPEALP